MTLSKEFIASGAHLPPGETGEAKRAFAWPAGKVPSLREEVACLRVLRSPEGAGSSLKCIGGRQSALRICLGELKAQSPFPRGSSGFIFIHSVLQV